MKEYIVITILDNIVFFDYRTINDDEKVFLNKNSLYKDSLYYTLKKYKKNIKKIISLIKELNKEIKTFRILKLITFKYVIPIINELNIENLILDFSSTLDLSDYDLFLNTNLKNIYCYYMPRGVVKKFESNGTKIYKSNLKEVSFEFLNQQDAFEIDTLYYKKVIKIKKEYPNLINDLEEFLKINYNLKAIHVYVYSKELIESIVDLVKNDESRNVVVFLHQGYDKGNFIGQNFDWLKNLSNKCKEDYTCEFRIIYSNSFLKNNLFKQLTFNNLKLISVLCIYVSLVCLAIVKAYDYIEQVSIDTLNNTLINESYAANNTNTDEENEDDTLDNLPTISENLELNDNEVEPKEEETKDQIKSKYSFENSLKSLKKINKETIGYLIVNNTNIAYPVVQHSDNNYYLKYDIYKKRNSMGWIYLDYRNNSKTLDDNNIIYGHNMSNGTMFGTLKKVLNSTWRKNEENLIISFDTESGKYKFKIFSIYKVDYTTDYLKVKFDSKNEKKDFIKLIKGRSSYKFNTDVGEDDKILTLSTCTGNNNKRLVVHAVLLKGEEE